MYMRKSLIRTFYLFAPILYLSLTMTSCSSEKKIKYFQDIPDSGQVKQIPKPDYTPPEIRIGDILTIIVETVNPISQSLVNPGSISSGGISSAAGGVLALLAPESGYLVDKDGNIQMPIIGKVKAVGYTTSQLKDVVQNLSSKYFKDPVVVVRFANFKVNIVGEVAKPGQYIMPDEKETILDAITMAGDLTVFGKRENVLLVRENLDGTKSAYRINLKKSNIMYSPVYYLRQNDMIYVEPRTAKSDATDAAQTRYIGIASAVLSVLIILATRTK
jgi:polysaccharide export outer membrane protein